ncbi:hypothetical protein MJG53_009327 [Ovis ammon polii x Ovis aries]|uniref:Uncharacterized protein n=1 Tax=Ovis ammon polii x Ovis aries TaxID=2918886 RepID=A0ACB9UWB7_9CETA|nr:hypothetical protein MJG53_009327 [Ovis ammon polii x Ovis aries]
MEDRSEVQASSWPRPKRSVAVRGSGFCEGCSSRGTPGDPSPLHRVSLQRRGEESGFRPGVLASVSGQQNRGRGLMEQGSQDLSSSPRLPQRAVMCASHSPGGTLSSVRGDHLGHRDSAPAPRPTEQEISEQRAGDRCLSHGEVSLPSGRLTTRQGDSQEQTFLSWSAVQPLGSRYPLCVALFHVALQVSDVQLWSRALDARPLWIAWILAIGEAEVFRHLSFDVRYRLLCAAAVMPVCRESDVPRSEILSQGPQQQSHCSQANWGPRKPDAEDVSQQWSLQEQSLRHQHSCAVEELRIPIASQKAAAISFSPEVPNPQRSAKFPSD